MGRRTCEVILACAACIGLTAALPQRASTLITTTPPSPAAKTIPVYRTRQSATDLEVIGMLPGLPDGATGYVHYADLATLPQVTVAIHGDENFSEISKTQIIRVTGVYLDAMARALGAFPNSDLIAASCTDGYRAHYPASYIALHHPILALRIDHLIPAEWALKTHQEDLGPYFITHSDFRPAFKILAHDDQPQVPTNVVRLDFNTTTSTFGAIAPRGQSPGSPEEQGFAIAKQNCLRCHNQGPYGGVKSGLTWTMLSTWAREQPAYFSAYVHNPKVMEPAAKMPANPEYDAATLAALTAYFRTFTAPPAENNR